jgi:hypothetical protein
VLNPYSFEITQDTHFVAYYERIEFDLTLKIEPPNPSGIGTVSGGGKQMCGNSVYVVVEVIHNC